MSWDLECLVRKPKEVVEYKYDPDTKFYKLKA